MNQDILSFQFTTANHQLLIFLYQTHLFLPLMYQNLRNREYRFPAHIIIIGTQACLIPDDWETIVSFNWVLWVARGGESVVVDMHVLASSISGGEPTLCRLELRLKSS